MIATEFLNSNFNQEDMETQITKIIDQMTLDEKCSILHGDTMFTSPGIERLNIPGFKMSDGPHGVRNEKGATAFPISVALTATWDPYLMESVGAAYGREFKGANFNMALGPAVDIGRDPRNGRASETIGEEPYLGGKIFSAFTRGVQSNYLIATVKHFLAQNHDATRLTTNPLMDIRTMREFYSLPFKMVVKEGEVLSIMSSYNYVNGLPCSQYNETLTKMLREEWGYEYFVVSDWWGTYNAPEYTINAGLDIEMPNSWKFKDLKSAVENGKITIDTLNLAVRRTLRSRIKSGMLDPSTPKGKPEDINSPDNQRINLEAAKKSLILLKNNDNILPLKKDVSIALIGPNALDMPLTSFGSSEVTYPAYKISPKDGISNSYPNVKLSYEKGCDINNNNSTSDFDAALKIASESEYVIFVGGLDKTQEGEAYEERLNMDRTGGSVMLPNNQRQLIKELSKVNKNIIVILMSGGIVSLGDTVDNIQGLLYAFYCGNECGNAIAQTLFGDFNPGGKLPISMPVDDSQLPEWENLNFTNDMINGFGYRRFDKTGEKPIFNFGHGLSYTQFEYKNLVLSKESIEGKETLSVSVEISNVGSYDGDEVLQLYLSQEVSVEMPHKQLRGFKRVFIQVGETKTVELVLTSEELSYWSDKHSHHFVEKGKYIIRIGASSDNIRLVKDFNVSSDYIIPHAKSKYIE